jgi:2-C-methyl-D-erythritol 4-phosphate cytidylyltransferase
MKKNIFAIVPAAGLGRRFGASKRKTFVDLHEVPLLIHTLRRLHTEEAVTEIVPVLGEQDIERGTIMIRSCRFSKINRIVLGGRERQDSVNNALTILRDERSGSLDGSLILIHDGVRPVIPEGTVDALVQSVQGQGADGAVPGIPPRDTLKRVGKDGRVLSTINRDEIRAIQTPQLFPFTVIKEAYELACKDNFYATDDAALVERMGGTVNVIEGSPSNIKITTPEDLEMVEYLLRNQKVISSR